MKLLPSHRILVDAQRAVAENLHDNHSSAGVFDAFGRWLRQNPPEGQTGPKDESP